jgi:DnaJ-domain-containing protein 1
MIDYFAVLDEPRRAWLDPEALKVKFLSLSAAVHPDRVHGQPESERQAAQDRYTQLNAAYQCLRDTKSRLHHLLELERGGKLQDVQDIPPETMDLFFQVGKLCREVDQFLAERRQASSPLLKVEMFQSGQNSHSKLSQITIDLAGRISALESELKTFPSTARIEAIYRLISYYSRWRGQLQERAVQLALD